MAVPIISKVNTLGITYTQGKICDYHYETIFENIMGIPEDEIDGIDDRDVNRFIFQVTTNERYNALCTKFTCRDIFLEYGHIIRVDDISSEGTRVEISRVPFDVSNEMLTTILASYGDVLKCQTYFRKYGKYDKCNKSGIRIAWMNIKSHIPSTINIKQINNFINVKYEEQPFSCNVCGRTGHRARSCRVKASDYINTIHTNLFDNDNNDNDDDDDSNVDFVDLDIHIDPSQNSKKFDCLECDYSCSYEYILIEHMESHTREVTPTVVSTLLDTKKDKKQNKCYICDYVCDNVKSLEDHMIAHENEILLNCTECDFNCRNLEVLNIHLASHSIYACKNCDFKSKSEKELKNHMQTHTGEKDHIDIDSGGPMTPEHVIAVIESVSAKNSKRGLSVSPEVLDTIKKTLRSNHNHKKTKT